MQVILNLQSNALKFTREGKVEIRVRITDENFLEVKIIDTGVGIKEEDQPKLFQLFGFLENTQSMNTSGIGLGLVISKDIVTQYDGSIKVESEYEKGTTFTFTAKLKNEVFVEEEKRSSNDN
jgi:signal transduction histidine kinase